MDSHAFQIDPQQLIEVGIAAGCVVASGVSGFLLVRKARARRRLELEDVPPGARGSAQLRAPTPEPRSRAAPPAAAPPHAPRVPVTRRETPHEPPAAPDPGARKLDLGSPASQPRPTRHPYSTRGAVAPVPAPPPGTPDTEPPPGGGQPRPVTGLPAAPILKIVPPPSSLPPPPVAPPRIANDVALDPTALPAPSPKKKDVEAMGLGLARTRAGWISRLGQVFVGKREIDPTVLDDIEKILLTADIGVRTSQKLLEEMRTSLSKKELGSVDSLWEFLRRRTSQLLSNGPKPLTWEAPGSPFVLLIIGVNGSGKTTTIGKLAALLTASGKKVLVGAGDTFRAAAAEQLEIWANRVGATIVRGKEGADPSSVLFDAVKRAKTEGFDVVIADTAGRLHTKTDLMEELQKVRRVIGKAADGAPHETWLVIDSTSGQNAIAQAQIFTQAMAVSGIVLTKLDGTAKGGVILGIADQLQIPVRFVGIGERVEDLRPFDPDEFVEALYAPSAMPN